jgi:cytochrome c
MRLAIIGTALGALALAGCGGGGGGTLTNDDPAVKKLVAELGPDYAAADVVNGRTKFELCRACHTIVKDGPNMTGPNLYGVFGAKAGSKTFNYSDALKAAGTRRPWTSGSPARATMWREPRCPSPACPTPRTGAT